MEHNDTLELALETARIRESLPSPAKRRLLRESAGITQAELAAAIGVQAPAVSRWETGQRHPSKPYAIAYATALARLVEEVRQ